MKEQGANYRGELVIKKRRRFRSYSCHLIFLLCSLFFTSWLIFAIENFRSYRHFPHMQEIFFASLAICAILLITLIVKYFAYSFIIYDRRIDVNKGLFFNKITSLWIYEITDVSYHRGPFQLFTGDATITIKHTGGPPISITGLGNRKFMRKIWDELRDSSLVERRSMKNWWV